MGGAFHEARRRHRIHPLNEEAMSSPEVSVDSPAIANVLTISPSDEDRRILCDMLRRFHWALYPNLKWEVHGSSSVASGLEYLRMHQVQVVLCEADLQLGSWSEILRRMANLPWSPLLIVASHRVDANLWAEALYLGAHAVLWKPFRCHEVFRSLRSSWLLWKARNQMPLTAGRV